MRLVLNNVRQHKRLELDLPDSGLVLLSAPSGFGKTTIFDAITDILLGCGDDMQPWGESGYSGTLEGFAPSLLRVTRTRNPATLEAETESGILKDDAAQAHILSVLGMNEHEFLASSYIRQGMDGSLLTLGPTDQLRFIQSLSSGAHDPEKFREKILESIKEKEKAVDSTKVTMEMHEASRALAQAKLEKAQASIIPFNSTHSQEDLFAAKEKAEELNKEGASHLVSLRSVDKKMANPLYKEVETASAALSAREEEWISSKTRLNEALIDIACAPRPMDDEEKLGLSQSMAYLNEKTNYLGKKAEAKLLAAEIQGRYPKATGKSLIEFLTELKALLELRREEESSVKTEYSRLKKELSGLIPHQPCPECAAPLIILGGKIRRGADPIENREAQLRKANELLEESNQRSALISEEMSYAIDRASKMSELKKALAVDPLPSISKPEEIIALKLEITEKVKADQQKINEHAVRLLTKKQTEKNIAELEKTIEKCKDKLTEVSRLEPMEDLVKARLDLHTKLGANEAELQSLQVLLAEYNDYVKWKENSDKLDFLSSSLADDIAEINENITKAGAELRVLLAKLKAAYALRDYSDLAATQAIEDTIENINANAKSALDRFFPDDGTSIKIRNTTANKKGQEKPKLSLEIFHKGKTPKKISGLSGGERSRITLAFQLALSDMYSSKVLMIDEGLAGLDDQNKRDCIEVLKEYADQKLILVVEHGAPESSFDSVVRI